MQWRGPKSSNSALADLIPTKTLEIIKYRVSLQIYNNIENFLNKAGGYGFTSYYNRLNVVFFLILEYSAILRTYSAHTPHLFKLRIPI